MWEDPTFRTLATGRGEQTKSIVADLDQIPSCLLALAANLGCELDRQQQEDQGQKKVLRTVCLDCLR